MLRQFEVARPQSLLSPIEHGLYENQAFHVSRLCEKGKGREEGKRTYSHKLAS